MEQGTLIRAPKHGDFLFKGVGRFKVEETKWEEYYTAKGVVETGKALRNFATTKRNESLEIYSLKKITKKIMKPYILKDIRATTPTIQSRLTALCKVELMMYVSVFIMA